MPLTVEHERLYQLSAEQWAQIEPSFPQRRGESGFEAKITNRDGFEAVLFRVRTGCPWRDLPSAYGGWHAINTRWQRWVRKGLPQRALVAWYLEQTRAGTLNLDLALLDSTIVRAHQHAAGARKKRATRLSGAAGAA